MISSKTNFEHVRTIHFRAGIRNFVVISVVLMLDRIKW